MRVSEVAFGSAVLLLQLVEVAHSPTNFQPSVGGKGTKDDPVDLESSGRLSLIGASISNVHFGLEDDKKNITTRNQLTTRDSVTKIRSLRHSHFLWKTVESLILGTYFHRILFVVP